MSHMHDYSIAALLLVSRILEFIPPDIYTVPEPDLEIMGGRSPKKLFLALWGSVWSKKRGARVPRAPPLDPPLLHTNSLSEKFDKRSRYFSFLIILQILMAFSLDDVLILLGEC